MILRKKWLAYCGLGIAAALSKGVFAQQESSMILGNTPFHLLEESEAGTRADAPAAARLDSARWRLPYDIDAGYRRPPVHPYFRDEYRILHDVRQLLQFVDRHAIHGMESLPEMKALAESMPPQKQTEIIRTAVAGSLVNFASETVSRQLRRKNMGFVQWQLEKVSLRRQIGQVYLNWYGGVNAAGMHAAIPAWRLYYARHETNYYRYDSFTYWPLPQIGFNYMLLDKRTLIGPRFSFGPSHLAISYDKDIRMLISGFALRQANRVIIRMEYVNYFALANVDYLRSEVLLQW